MNLLSSEYENLIGYTPIEVYVTPNIHDIQQSNDYLKLLYKDCLNEQDRNQIFVNAFRIRDFPKLILKRLKGEASILHHHWFGFHNAKTFFIICSKVFWMSIYKAIGGKIVWTVHNKFPHGQRFVTLNQLFRKYMATILADRLHVHCDLAIDIMSNVLSVRKSKFFVVRHPMYSVNIYSKERAISEVNEIDNTIQVSDQNKIFLVFGQISVYKGIDEIIKTFVEAATCNENWILIIAGNAYTQKNKKYLHDVIVRNHKYLNNNLYIVNQFCSNELTDTLFNASDVVVFNYKEILTSGGVALALSYDKSIIIPKKGCLNELDGENITSFECLNVGVYEAAVSNLSGSSKK
jgi:beta-1,4-mannosyltransferase